MTMVLCGWIVLILQVQSVFNCPGVSSPPYDPCCPDEDECCDDVRLSGEYNRRGVCCTDNNRFYAIGSETEKSDQCLCTTESNDWYGVMLPFVKARWGHWGEWQYCPEGGYVVGMKVKAESYQGIEQSTNLREVSQCPEKAPAPAPM